MRGKRQVKKRQGKRQGGELTHPNMCDSEQAKLQSVPKWIPN